MQLNQENINQFLDKYIDLTNRISYKYNYENNIRHLLYLIIPAFILKYGIQNESIILKCFEETKIYISDKENKIFTASFNRIIKKDNSKNEEAYYTQKYILLNEYKTSTFTNFFDNIIHEFNHAVNSINYEIMFDEKIVKIRTGLTYLYYDKNNLQVCIKKDDALTLEEIINTEQTNKIINIIRSFNDYDIQNEEFKNTLYSLKNEIKGDKYVSSSYQFQTYICKELMNNKTFVPTLENLRFKGLIQDIPSWFDNIIGKDGEYRRLISLLTQIHSLEIKLRNVMLFKKFKLNQIRDKAKKAMNIINDFDNKCIYK